jgi:hypothetical protein
MCSHEPDAGSVNDGDNRTNLQYEYASGVSASLGLHGLSLLRLHISATSATVAFRSISAPSVAHALPIGSS